MSNLLEGQRFGCHGEEGWKLSELSSVHKVQITIMSPVKSSVFSKLSGVSIFEICRPFKVEPL